MIDVSITASKAKASFDPFDPKSVEVGTKVPLLSIRRPRDLPPTLADRQRAIVESVAALVRPVVPCLQHGLFTSGTCQNTTQARTISIARCAGIRRSAAEPSTGGGGLRDARP